MNTQQQVIGNYTDASTGGFWGWNVVGNYKPTNAVSPFDGNQVCIVTQLNYGTQVPAVAPIGTAAGVASYLNLFNCGDGLSEMALYGGYMDFQNNNFGFGNLTPGRAWGFDCIVNGAYATQQSALGGFHAVLNNYYAGLPLDNTSGNFWAVTSPGFTLGEITNVGLLNYPIVGGFGVLGFGSAPTTLGFMTGIQVGGRGSNWGIARSHLTIGADISDYGGIGLYIHRKYSGITGVTLNPPGGANYTANPPVNFSGGGITLATGYQASGIGILSPTQVASVTMISQGSGFASAPAVIFDPPFPGGAGTSTAMGTAQIDSNGHVTGVTLIPPNMGGQGYTTNPGITFTGGGGSGASATAIMSPTSLSGIAITDPGFGYTSAPTITIPGGNPNATATATIQGTGIEGILVTFGGTGYLGKHPPTLNISGGSGATASAAIDPTGAVSAVMITNASTGYSSPGVTISPPPTSINATLGTPVVLNGSVVSIPVTEGGGYYLTPPTVTIDAPLLPFGVQALALAYLFAGRLGYIAMTNQGSGYSSASLPHVSLSDGTFAPQNTAQAKPIQGGVALAVDADAGPVIFGGILPLGAELNVLTTAPTNKGSTIKAATSQTANLQEFQDASGNILGSIGASGAWTGSVDLMSGTTITLDVTKGTLHTLSVTGLTSINASGPGNSAQEMTVLLKNTSGGSQNVTFSIVFKLAGSPTVAILNNTATLLRFVSDGVNWYELCRATPSLT
jgi:hypothetical protein